MGAIKQEYVVPDMMELRVDSEKVICASGTKYTFDYTYPSVTQDGRSPNNADYYLYNRYGQGTESTWR